MKRTKVGLVGCGEHSLENLLPNLWLNSKAEITAVVDPSPENLGRAKQLLPSARGFSNHEAMFLECPVDAVVVAATPQIHHAVAKLALVGGVHIFVEKPASITTAELAELAKLAEQENRLAMVGHNIRYCHASMKMKELSAARDFGKPIAMEVRYFASKPRGDRWGVGSPLRSFLLSHMSHALDFVGYHLGDLGKIKAEGVRSSDGTTTVSIQSRTEDGAVFTLLATNSCPHFSIHSTLLGSAGSYINMESLNLVTAYGGAADGKRNGRIWVEQELTTGWGHAGYAAELDIFLSGIESGKAVAPSFRDELAVMEAIDQIEEQIIAQQAQLH